jgi:hypothetical protein
MDVQKQGKSRKAGYGESSSFATKTQIIFINTNGKPKKT